MATPNNRLTKLLFSSAIGLYITLVAMNNMVDYGSNFTYVRMVATMDDIFSKDTNGWRSIHTLWMHHLLFILIIGTEVLIAVMLWVGVYQMSRR